MRPRKIQFVLSDDRQYVVIGIVCAVVVCTLILQARLDGAILAVLIVSVRAVCPSVFVDFFGVVSHHPRFLGNILGSSLVLPVCSVP